jgi:hypothetical protein
VVIGLVACAKSKLDRAAPARELYCSPLFRGSLAYAEQRCERVYIVSAKHGLVRPDEVIAPYDETVKRMAQRERQLWGARIVTALLTEHRAGDEYLVLASGDYIAPIVDAWLTGGVGELFLRKPLEGMQIGQRLAFLKQANAVREAA